MDTVAFIVALAVPRNGRKTVLLYTRAEDSGEPLALIDRLPENPLTPLIVTVAFVVTMGEVALTIGTGSGLTVKVRLCATTVRVAE